MRLKDLIGGIDTLSVHYDDSSGFHTSAEHDIFYMYPTDTPLNQTDVQSMIDFGWFQEDVEICGEDMIASEYDPEESWAAYT